MRTPIGPLQATMTFVEKDGELTGTAGDEDARAPLRNLRVESSTAGEHVTWNQTITKPIRLELEFDVIVLASRMTGHSIAGRLPKTSVSGSRRTP